MSGPGAVALRGAACLALAAGIGAAVAGRARSPVAEPPTAPVSGLAASLEDEVRPLTGARIRWSTSWALRWTPPPGAKHYELQLVTAEGPSPRLRQVPAPPFRIEVAAGENPRKEGLRRRKLLLALAAGQVGYRVRAVLPGNQVTPWSTTVPAGQLFSMP